MTPTTTTPPTILRRPPFFSGERRRPAGSFEEDNDGDGAGHFFSARASRNDVGGKASPRAARPRRRAGCGGRSVRAGEHGEHGTDGAQERWLLTYADMITLLVAFFIMLYATASQSPSPDAAQPNAARRQFQNGVRSALLGVGEPPRPINNGRIVVAPPVRREGAAPAQQRLFGRMAAWIARRHFGSQVRLEAEPGGVVVRLDSGAMLFDTGTAALQPRGAEIVDALEDVLAPEIAAGQVRAVRVGGHTDDQPVAPGSPWGSNWQLSSARAAGVAARLAGRGGANLAARLEATGYGQSRPVAANDNENGRRRNRRVEIRILLAQNAPATDNE